MGVARKLAEGITGLGPDIMTDEVTKWTLYGLLDLWP